VETGFGGGEWVKSPWKRQAQGGGTPNHLGVTLGRRWEEKEEERSRMRVVKTVQRGF
jgi:hypothetical protein